MPGSSRRSTSRRAKTMETAEIALRNPDFIGIRFSRPACAAARGRRHRRSSAGTQEPDPRQTRWCCKADDVLLATATAPERARGRSGVVRRTPAGKNDRPQRGSRLSPGLRLEPAPWSGRHWETSAFPRASPVRSRMSEGAMPTCCLSPTSFWKSATGSDCLATAAKRRPSGSFSAIRSGARPNSASSRSASVPRSACCWG